MNSPLNIVNSRDILLSEALTFLRGLNLNDSGVVANGGVTVQNININQNGISVGGGSNLNFGTGNATVSTVTGTGSGRDGINVGPGSTATISNATITGWSRGARSHDGGLVAINGGSGPVDISSNHLGVTAENQGSLIMFVAVNPIRIHDNAAGGVEIVAGMGIMLGTVLVDAIKVDNNGGDGISVAAGFAQISGVTVSSNAGRAVVFDLVSTGALGRSGSVSWFDCGRTDAKHLHRLDLRRVLMGHRKLRGWSHEHVSS